MKILVFIISFISYLSAAQPAWLLDPSIGGKFTGAIGCAKVQKREGVQEKMAFLRAKGAISQQIAATVEDKTHMESNLEDDNFDEEFSFESKQTSSSTFEIKKMATYTNADKLLCVWVVKK